MAQIEWPLLGMWMGIAITVGLLIFHGVAGFYHLKYYVLRADDPENWKCQPERRLPARLQRKAVLLSSGNLVVAGALTGVLLYAIDKGLSTRIYYEVAEYGWTYTLLSTAALFVMVDGLAYYVHRALHGEFLYRKFHRTHHAYIATTPYVTAAIHPLVFVSLQVATFAPVALFPFHAASIAVVFIYVLVFNIMGHSGVVLTSRLPWQASSNFHDDHHAHFHVNFGQHLTIWDRLHGTLRVTGRSYGVDVFGGRGVADADARSDARLPY
jgi:sterol desaturase/sphingolipid hydroxylase (fatty acid hydroxylase superfamily)